jgi:hypothetical protein
MRRNLIWYTVTSISEELAVIFLRVVRYFWTIYQSTELHMSLKVTIQYHYCENVTSYTGHHPTVYPYVRFN